MSSKEIADLLEKEHRDVLVSMERLEKRKLIQCLTSMTQNPNGGRKAKILSVNKRDSYVVVAQLSPEFTARIVDLLEVRHDKVKQYIERLADKEGISVPPMGEAPSKATAGAPHPTREGPSRSSPHSHQHDHPSPMV